MTQQEKYWKERCEAAESLIENIKFCNESCDWNPTISINWIRKKQSEPPAPAQGVEEEDIQRLKELCKMHTVNPSLLEAAENVIESMFWLYTARNGRKMSIEDTSGEKCWIVPDEKIEILKAAIEYAKKLSNL